MGLLLGNAPIPLNDTLVDERRYVTSAWVDWMSQLNQVVTQGPTSLQVVNLVDQAASISATDFSGGSVNAGFYRLSYYAQITQAATTNSSLTVTLNWANGTTLTFSGAAITGNTTTTYQQETVLVKVSAAPVTYTTTYASTGATPMQYSLGLVFEMVSA